MTEPVPLDADLQSIAENIFAISPKACIRLLHSLQLHRDAARSAFDLASQKHAEASASGNIEVVSQAFADTMLHLQELVWKLDLDHIDWHELEEPD